MKQINDKFHIILFIKYARVEPRKQYTKTTFGHRFHCLVDKDCYLQRIEFGLPNQFNKYKGNSDVLLETLADSSIRHQERDQHISYRPSRTKERFEEPCQGCKDSVDWKIFQEKSHRALRFARAQCRIRLERWTIQS